MNDVIFLGIASVGLGLYCLHLRSECNKLNKAGQHLTRMLFEQIEGNASPELITLRAYIEALKEKQRGQ